MKKLISLLSAVAMLALVAVPASAALQYDNGAGVYVISELPTDAEVAGYTPTLSVSTEKATAVTDLKTWKNIALQMKYNATFANYDFYKITYTMEDIGTFVNGYDSGFSNAFFGLYNVTVSFDGSVLPEGSVVEVLTYTLPNGTTGNTSAGVDQGTKYLNALYTAAGVSNDTIYPPIDSDGMGVVSDEGIFKIAYVLAVPAGSNVTIPYVGTKIVYKAVSGSENRTPENVSVTCDDIVLGEKEPDPVPDPVPEFDVKAPVKLANGWAWDVTINGFDSVNTYIATFTAGGETKVNELNFEGAEIGADSSVAFAALLKTTKGAVELALSK